MSVRTPSATQLLNKVDRLCIADRLPDLIKGNPETVTEIEPQRSTMATYKIEELYDSPRRASSFSWYACENFREISRTSIKSSSPNR